MKKFKKSDIGKTFKQASGYKSTIIGSFKKGNERIFAATTNNPETPYLLYWDNGNCFCFHKNSKLPINNFIRKI